MEREEYRAPLETEIGAGLPTAERNWVRAATLRGVMVEAL